MKNTQIRQNQQTFLRNALLLTAFVAECTKRRQKIIFVIGVRGEPSFFICVLNPVKYTDPDGKVLHIAIGFAVGAAVAAGFSIVGQLTDPGNTQKTIDPAKTIRDAAIGGVSGALGASGIGLVGQMIGNAVLNGGNELIDQLTDNEDGVSALSVGLSTALGAFGGLAGGPGKKDLPRLGTQLINRVSNATKHMKGEAMYKEIAKAFGNYMKNSKTLNKEMAKNVFREALKGGLSETAIDTIIKLIDKEPTE